MFPSCFLLLKARDRILYFEMAISGWGASTFSRGGHMAGYCFLRGLIPVIVLVGLVSTAFGAEAWKDEFDRLCGVTDQATTFSEEELKTLIHDCDKLTEILKGMDIPKKKLYLFRIKKCRNLFSFVLDTKKHSSRFTEFPVYAFSTFPVAVSS